MKLVLSITAGILLAVGVLVIGLGVLLGSASESATSSVEKSGLADYGDKARPITKVEYQSVKVGDKIASLTTRFGEPSTIVHGKEIARDQDDVYSWKQAGGGLLDLYTFDVDPSSKKVVAKALY
jgi:hypothetical protein